MNTDIQHMFPVDIGKTVEHNNSKLAYIQAVNFKVQ